MPKTLTASLSHAQASAPSPRAAKQAWRAPPIESRVAALEARWEETVPTLSTIADLRGVENRLIIWILGAAFSLLFAVLGIFLSGYNSINERFDSVNTQIHSVNARIDSAVTELRAENRAVIADLKEETRASIAELRAEIRETKEETRASIAELRTSITELRTEIRETNSRMDAKFDALMAELRSQRNDAH